MKVESVTGGQVSGKAFCHWGELLFLVLGAFRSCLGWERLKMPCSPRRSGFRVELVEGAGPHV